MSNESVNQPNLPLALILGGNKGLSGALSSLLEQHYRAVHISRTSTPFAGDLRSSQFRAKVAEQFSPELIISSFGTWEDTHSLVSALETFLMPNIDLFERFERKGSLKKFVLISSASARFSSQPSFSRSEVNYTASKRAVSDAFQQLQLWSRSQAKILIFEPGFVATDFARINERMRSPSEYDLLRRAGIQPMSPEDVAETLLPLILNSNLGDATLSAFNHLGDHLRG